MKNKKESQGSKSINSIPFSKHEWIIDVQFFYLQGREHASIFRLIRELYQDESAWGGW